MKRRNHGSLYGNLSGSDRSFRDRCVWFFLSYDEKLCLIKNMVFPLIFLGVLLVLRPSYPIALLLLLQSAVPPVTAISIFTQRAGGNQSIVNQFLIASFVCSLVSIPLMVTLFSLFFSG